MLRSLSIRLSAFLLPLILALVVVPPQTVSAGVDSEGTGPVGLADLIALALKNDPGLIAARGEIPIAEARKRAETQWPDPQIRFRKTWGYNEVPAPYTETRKESYQQRVQRTRVNEDGERETTSATETVHRTTEQRITEGRDATRIEETVRESSSENGETEPNAATFSPGGSTSDDRSLYRSGNETRYHNVDPFASEEDLSIQLRLYVPHPGIRKARLAKAQHRIELAQAQALAAEREVVLKVRELYEELQYLLARLELAKRGNDAGNAFEKAQDELLDGGFITIDEVEWVKMDPFAADEARMDFESRRAELAARVGLRKAERIRVSDRLISPAVNLDHTHLEYLIRMAFANRGELAAIRGRGQIAEADLQEVQAKHIPWFDYIQAEAGRGEQGNVKTDTSWGISFAMSLPVFTWMGHEKEIHEAAIASHYGQMSASKKVVTAEVVAAYQNIKRAASFRGRARSASVKQSARNKSFLSKLEGMNPHKYEETRYDINRSTTDTDRYRLDAERRYNRALLKLEEALGATLEDIFSQSAKAGAPEVFAAAAAPAAPKEKTVKKEVTASAAPSVPQKVAKTGPNKLSISAPTRGMHPRRPRSVTPNKHSPAADKSESPTSQKRPGLFDKLKNSPKGSGNARRSFGNGRKR